LIFRYKPPAVDPKYAKYFVKQNDPVLAYYTCCGTFSPVQGPFARVLEIKPDAGTVKQDIVLERASALPVKIVDAAGRPVKGAWFSGMHSQWYYPIQLAESVCNVYHVEPGRPRLLAVYDPAGNQFGTLRLKGDETKPAVVKLGPAGTVKGRLLDDKGRPLSGFGVGVFHWWDAAAGEIRNRFGKASATDADGKFTAQVVPGAHLKMFFTCGKRSFWPQRKMESVPPGKTLDLGAVMIKVPPGEE